MNVKLEIDVMMKLVLKLLLQFFLNHLLVYMHDICIYLNTLHLNQGIIAEFWFLPLGKEDFCQ